MVCLGLGGFVARVLLIEVRRSDDTHRVTSASGQTPYGRVSIRACTGTYPHSEHILPDFVWKSRNPSQLERLTEFCMMKSCGHSPSDCLEGRSLTAEVALALRAVHRNLRHCAVNSEVFDLPRPRLPDAAPCHQCGIGCAARSILFKVSMAGGAARPEGSRHAGLSYITSVFQTSPKGCVSRRASDNATSPVAVASGAPPAANTIRPSIAQPFG